MKKVCIVGSFIWSSAIGMEQPIDHRLFETPTLDIIMRRIGITELPSHRVLNAHIALMEEIRHEVPIRKPVFFETLHPEVKSAVPTDLQQILPIQLLNSIGFSDNDSLIQKAGRIANLAFKIKDLPLENNLEKKRHIANCLSAAAAYTKRAVHEQIEEKYADFYLSSAQYYYWASFYAPEKRQINLRRQAKQMCQLAKENLSISNIYLFKPLTIKTQQLDEILKGY